MKANAASLMLPRSLHGTLDSPCVTENLNPREVKYVAQIHTTQEEVKPDSIFTSD